MAKQRSTFSKFQRERDKKAKAAAKRERRENKPDMPEEEAPARPQVDQTVVLEALAELHRDFDDGRINAEDFEKRREELITQIDVD